ncbi:MAG: hypothetical protein NTW86_06155, partial [Candidatus Sumerlaeota bacterium]|nr:hypothetical protein [Candidatus Sumerlaeota bacterium]
AAPSGGAITLHYYLQSIGRQRANELRYPQQFGYHGWESELVGKIVMDRAATRKVLGITDAQFDTITDWWKANKESVEQKWWWWLYDEGGCVQTGGKGRLNVRMALGCGLQIWLNTLDLSYDRASEKATLTWDLVDMSGEFLLLRWIRESVDMNYEGTEPSDITLNMTIGPDGADMDADMAQAWVLCKNSGSNVWDFEPVWADVCNLTSEYLNESIYESPSKPYADLTDTDGNGYTNAPSAWNLKSGETLTFDFSDNAAKGKISVGFRKLEPPNKEFAKQMTVVDGQKIQYRGPIDFAAWSKGWSTSDWARLGGLLPWGEPYLMLLIKPLGDTDFPDPPQPAPQPTSDPDRVIPPFPDPALEPTPPLPSSGRTVKYDFYKFFDVPMVADRWKEYAANDYVRINSLAYPVSYQTTAYFTSANASQVAPFDDKSSGCRLRVTARNLPEIAIDKIGGGSQPAGFLPRNLMGGLPEGVAGGTATYNLHLQYGTRDREHIYRQQEYWGYYGWENFIDARLTMDKAGAEKVLGIADAEFTDFQAWFAKNKGNLQDKWRLWIYEEFKKAKPMPFFNYPIEIWALDIRHVSNSPTEVVLDMMILNEAHDVLLGRWFNQTFMPKFEAPYSDMFLKMAIGPSSADVDLDTALDWYLYGDVASTSEVEPWVMDVETGDNPFLCNQYRLTNSPAYPYYALDQGFDHTPTAWDLAAGEQVNVHFADAGLDLTGMRPAPADFPKGITYTPGRLYSITGPVDLTAWSRAKFPEDWKRAGGLLPSGLPRLEFTESGKTSDQR